MIQEYCCSEICKSWSTVGAATASVLRFRKLRIEPSMISPIIHHLSPLILGIYFVPSGICCKIQSDKFRLLVNNRTFTIWCNNDFAPEQESERALLISDVGDHRLLMFETNYDGQDDEFRAPLQIPDLPFASPHPHPATTSHTLPRTHPTTPAPP